MIKHNMPQITDKDCKAVELTLKSSWIASGNQVLLLERTINNIVGSGYSCAVSSGTKALEMALRSLGVVNNTSVAIPTYSCSALLNAVISAGSSPVVCDVDRDSFSLEKIDNKQVNAVVGVDIFGRPNMINSSVSNSLIIKDCAQSIKSLYSKNYLKNVDAIVFSFYATKVITGGYGGLVWFKKKCYADICRDYINFDCRKKYKPRSNVYMSDINASLVLSQLNRINFIQKRRSCICKRYLNALPSGFLVQDRDYIENETIYRFVLVCNGEKERRKLLKYFHLNEIEAVVPIRPWELLHRYCNLKREDFFNAESIAKRTLSLPLYPALSENEVDFIVKMIEGMGSVI